VADLTECAHAFDSIPRSCFSFQPQFLHGISQFLHCAHPRSLNNLALSLHSHDMRKRQKRILLALGWYDYRLHEGIARFAVEKGWHLCPDTTKEKVIPWGWGGDGILAWLGAGDDLAEFVVHARKPTVD